ncbi:unnamed protein product [Ceratitis capitata]|uniref:(Mediterranean fruit fly) hypothetical protein n=1 Tax=Ceratitis capitata TaxID=7213 RepID=A0A811V179_CERCA|nr:unnamed protein product [Ceratitis capitata]
MVMLHFVASVATSAHHKIHDFDYKLLLVLIALNSHIAMTTSNKVHKGIEIVLRNLKKNCNNNYNSYYNYKPFTPFKLQHISVVLAGEGAANATTTSHCRTNSRSLRPPALASAFARRYQQQSPVTFNSYKTYKHTYCVAYCFVQHSESTAKMPEQWE